jgi:hypothetical protein
MKLILAILGLLLPQLSTAEVFCNQKTTVAILDDGFDINHPKLQHYWWTNPEEVKNNRWDDDQDGYVDNIHGFDLADGDGNPSLPEGRGNEFYHGTFLSGVMVHLWETELGLKVNECLEILPVKLVSDKSVDMRLENTVLALELLKKRKVDVILMAWSQEQSAKKWRLVVEELAETSTILVAASGNNSTDSKFYPAALANVISVAAIDSMGYKLTKSNYGSWIDISAIGSENMGLVESGFAASDVAGFEGWVKMEGQSSSAAARVAATLALLKFKFPNKSKKDLQEALFLGASSHLQTEYPSMNKLGYGAVSYSGAYSFLKNPKSYNKNFKSIASKGVWNTGKSIELNLPRISNFDTLEFSVLNSVKPSELKGVLEVKSQGVSWGKKPLSKWFNFKSKLIFPTLSEMDFKFFPQKGSSNDITFRWNRLALDSSLLFCSGIKVWNKPSGVITDGSPQNNNYAQNTSCKWQIIAPPGMRIQVEFENLDTELGVDRVHFFNGTGTQQGEMLAMFSGKDRPPVINSTSNELLVWFVSDSQKSGNGWKLRYKFIDAKKHKAGVFLKPKI